MANISSCHLQNLGCREVCGYGLSHFQLEGLYSGLLIEHGGEVQRATSGDFRNQPFFHLGHSFLPPRAPLVFLLSLPSLPLQLHFPLLSSESIPHPVIQQDVWLGSCVSLDGRQAGTT